MFLQRFIQRNWADYNHTMRIAIWEGMFFNGFFIATQGFILITIALYFQTSPFMISILSVMPVIAQFLQILTPVYLKKCRSRKKALTIAAFGARVPFILLPLAVLTGFNYSWVLFLVILVFSVMSAFINNLWISGMRSLVPITKRGKYFGMRALFVSGSGMLFTLFYSYFLDLPWERFAVFIVVLLVSGFAVLTAYILSHHKFPDKKESSQRLDLKTPLTHWNFRSFLTFCAVWVFALELTRPFFFYFALEYMNISNSFLGQMSVVAGILSMILYMIYGKLADRIGNKTLLHLGINLSVLSPALYIIMNTGNAHFAIFLDHIIIAVSFSAVNLAFFNFLLETVDEPTESYLGVYAVVVGGVALGAGLLAGLLAEWLRPVSFDIFGHPFHGLQLLFMIGLIARFCAGFTLKNVEAVKETRFRALVFSYLGTGTFRARETFLGFYSQYFKGRGKKGKN